MMRYVDSIAFALDGTGAQRCLGYSAGSHGVWVRFSTVAQLRVVGRAD